MEDTTIPSELYGASEVMFNIGGRNKPDLQNKSKHKTEIRRGTLMVKTSCVLAPHLATARKGEDIEGDMTERGNRAQAEPGSRQASRTPSPSNKLQLKVKQMNYSLFKVQPRPILAIVLGWPF